MILELQLLGVLFSFVMIYFTFLYFKRRDYDVTSFIFWIVVWVWFMFIVLFPKTVYSIMQALKIERTVDFFVMSGFLFFAIMIFYMFGLVKKNQKKVEDLVRKIAIERAKK